MAGAAYGPVISLSVDGAGELWLCCDVGHVRVYSIESDFANLLDC